MFLVMEFGKLVVPGVYKKQAWANKGGLWASYALKMQKYQGLIQNVATEFSHI
jgi:hypothetical protein